MTRILLTWELDCNRSAFGVHKEMRTKNECRSMMIDGIILGKDKIQNVADKFSPLDVVMTS